MKHDDFYDQLYELAAEYRLTPWYKFLKARRLRNEITRRWHRFIEELSDEPVKLPVENLQVPVEDIQSHPLPERKLSSLP